MKHKLIAIALYILAFLFFLLLLTGISLAVMQTINAGQGFAIWIGAFLACLTSTTLAGGFATRRKRKPDRVLQANAEKGGERDGS